MEDFLKQHNIVRVDYSDYQYISDTYMLMKQYDKAVHETDMVCTSFETADGHTLYVVGDRGNHTRFNPIFDCEVYFDIDDAVYHMMELFKYCVEAEDETSIYLDGDLEDNLADAIATMYAV